MPSVVVILAEIYQRGGTDTSLVTVAVAEIPVDSCQFECPLYEPSTIFGQQRRVVGSMRGVLRLAWTGDPQKSRFVRYTQALFFLAHPTPVSHSVSSVKWENIIECSDRYSESLVNTMKKCNTSGISGVWGAPYHGLFIPFTLYVTAMCSLGPSPHLSSSPSIKDTMGWRHTTRVSKKPCLHLRLLHA